MILNFLFQCRHTFKVNKEAAELINETYHKDLIGKVCLLLFKLHQDKAICYTLDYKAEELYEEIFDKYNGQFNLKYSRSSDVCSSQSQLDHYEKSEINVRTKALELIGCLTCILWIY